MAAIDEPLHQPITGRRLAEIATGITNRRAGSIGVVFWAVGILALVLYATNVITSDLDFAMIDTWAIGAGCVGSPILALRLFGRTLTPYVSVLVGCCSFVAAAVLTALTAIGQMRPGALTITFSLVLFLALGTHALNSADIALKQDAKDERIEELEARVAELEQQVERAHEEGFDDGRDAGRLEGLGLARDEQLRRLRALESVKGVPLEAIETWYMHAFAEVNALDMAERPLLRIVPDPFADAPTEQLPRPHGYTNGTWRPTQSGETERRVPGS